MTPNAVVAESMLATYCIKILGDATQSSRQSNSWLCGHIISACIVREKEAARTSLGNGAQKWKKTS